SAVWALPKMSRTPPCPWRRTNPHGLPARFSTSPAAPSCDSSLSILLLEQARSMVIKRATHGGFWLPMVVAIAAFPGRIAAAPTIRQPPSVWELTPDLRFGDQGFTHILAILPDSDGSIVVADDRNQEVLVLSRDGSPSHRIGTNGRGPGEFLRVRGIGELGDTIGVIDRDRVALFLRDGTSVGVIRRESRGTLRALVPGGALGTESPLMSAEGMPPRLPVLRMTRGGATLDTIAWLPSRNM